MQGKGAGSLTECRVLRGGGWAVLHFWEMLLSFPVWSLSDFRIEAGSLHSCLLQTFNFPAQVIPTHTHCPAFEEHSACSVGLPLPPTDQAQLLTSPHILCSLLSYTCASLPFPLRLSLRSKVVTLNSCFSNRPHVTGYLSIGGFS